MASEPTKEQGPKIKQERREARTSAPVLKVTASAPPPLAHPLSNHGQQKITSYFGTNKQPLASKSVVEESGRKTPPLDIDSVKGVFGWTSFGNIHIPYILRKGENYAAVRMIEGKLLKKYLQALPPDVYNCTYIKSYFITENEAKLLNEINGFHCMYQFGNESFTPKDLVVPLDDARNFYEFLETCYSKLTNPALQEPSISRCGYIRVNGTVVPYVKRDGVQYVPLSFFEQDSEDLKMKAEKLEAWELPYMKFCYKILGLNSDVLSTNNGSIVSIDTVKQHVVGRLCLEDWWPSSSRTFATINMFQRQSGLPKNTVFQTSDKMLLKNEFDSTTVNNQKTVTKNESSSSNDKRTSIAVSTAGNGKLAAVPTTQSKPSIPLFATPEGVPNLTTAPWLTGSQPLLFNTQWFPMVSNTNPYLPTVIPGPNLTFEKFLQHMQSTAAVLPMQTKHPESSSLHSSLQRSEISNPTSVKAAADILHQGEPLNSTTLRQPPPLVRIETNNQSARGNSVRVDYGTPSASLHPSQQPARTLPSSQPSRISSHLRNSGNSRRSVVTSSSSLLTAARDAYVAASTSQVTTAGSAPKRSRLDKVLPVSTTWSSIASNLSGSVLNLGKPSSNYAENLVVAPGAHQTIKQTSPKPANLVPSVHGSLSPFFPRPPPPLIPANGAHISISPSLTGGVTHLPTALSSKSSFQDLFSLHSLPVLNNKSDSNSADKTSVRSHLDVVGGEQQPYKLQSRLVDGKELPVINLTPFVYNSTQLASLQDVVTTFFPNMTISNCQHILSEVLGVTLFEGNSVQQAVLANPRTTTMVQVEDISNYMPQLKYMSRIDCRGDSSMMSHPPKRIRL